MLCRDARPPSPMGTIMMKVAFDWHDGNESPARRDRPGGASGTRRIRFALTSRICAGALVLLAGGCGSGKLGNFDSPEPSGSSPSNKLGELLGFGKPPNNAPRDTQGPEVTCPGIVALEGTEVARFYTGSPPTSTNLRVQYSIEDLARECSRSGDTLVLKVGIAGKVLLGPAGSAGSFSVPVRVAVTRNSDQSAVVSKLYRAPATITARRTEESFTIVSEPISVPFVHARSDEDYSIKVGIDSGGGTEAAESGRRKR